MAYKKIILGFGILHLLVLLTLIFQIISERFTESTDSNQLLKTSFIQNATAINDNHSRVLIASSEAAPEFKNYFLGIAFLLSIFPFIVFSTVVVKKIKKYKRKQAELMGENKNKDLFFSVISHDLKAPAQQLIALSDLLAKTDDLPAEENKKISGLINTTAKKHYELLNNLLAWSTSQLYGKPIPKFPINLHEVAEQVIIAQKEKIDEKKIEVINQIGEDLSIVCNESLLSTILRNLLNNSIKFTPAQGQISFWTETAGTKHIHIYVKDTGIGMSPEILHHLFDLKYIRSMRGTNKEVGSGIGLIICKEIIEKIKGKISVSSEEREGTTFILKIPI
jgi:signal transduction histidine kinase